MLPPRRAALPLGTSSLGACGALLPREPRPVEGSRGSRPARRSCVPSLPTGDGGSLHRRSGGRERGAEACSGDLSRRGVPPVGRVRAAAPRYARAGEWARASADERQRARIDAVAATWSAPFVLRESAAAVRDPPGRAARGDRACRGATDLGSRMRNGVAERASAPTRTDRRTRRLGSGADRRRPGPTRRSSGTAPELVLLAEKRREDRLRARVRSVVRWAGARLTTPAPCSSGRPVPASAASRDLRAVEGARCSRRPRRAGSPRSVSVSWAGTARRRPRPAGTP